MLSQATHTVDAAFISPVGKTKRAGVLLPVLICNHVLAGRAHIFVRADSSVGVDI